MVARLSVRVVCYGGCVAVRVALGWVVGVGLCGASCRFPFIFYDFHYFCGISMHFFDRFLHYLNNVSVGGSYLFCNFV